jgi:anti-sigma regulatory factor (Ser/Thr protein kinase)
LRQDLSALPCEGATTGTKEAGVTNGSAAATITLAVDPRSAGAARRHVRGVLTDAGLDHLSETASLAVSELVTNAVVHAASVVELTVHVGGAHVRVEVEDRGAQVPIRRAYTDTMRTGRGVGLVEDTVTRWGVVDLPDGKVVWFELAV